MAVEKCTNCEETIENLETPYLFREQIVCEDCFQRLTRGKVSLPAATPSPAPVQQTPVQRSFREQPGREDKASTEPPSAMATAGMIMGILGFILPFCSILAIIFGAMAPKQKDGHIQDRAATAIMLGVFSLVIGVIVWIVIFSSINASGS